MMRHQEHHISSANIQRDPNRLGMHRMPPQPRNQPPMMVPSPIPVQQAERKGRLLIFLILFALCKPTRGRLSHDQLKELFHDKHCIEGVLVTMPTGPALITTAPIPQQATVKSAPPPIAVDTEASAPQTLPSTQKIAQNMNNTQSLPSTTLANTKEKTPMCLINELARYNKIQHQYRLTSEQGPAHQKRFTVTLKLGTEEYEAEGASIKKAQHSAAAEALLNTQFKHPPQKSARNVRTTGKHGAGILTPTVELNALAMKRGERTMYLLETVPPNPTPYLNQTGYYSRSNVYSQNQPRYGYDARRNHAGRGGSSGHYMGHYDQRYPPFNQYKPQMYPHLSSGDMFNVILRVGTREYTGEGHTVQAARHNAASKALHELKQLPMPGETERSNVPDLSTDLKSPISLVHEIALKRSMNVVFEVVSEKGPPHMKVFVTICRVDDLMAEGEGNGKKISKKRAAEKMLEKLSQLPPLPFMNDVTPRIKRKRVVPKKKIRNLIKVNQDKSGIEYQEDINPISRLIQIQQATKEKEPTYTVIEERGAPRRREFVMEASVNGISRTGTGPNKKLAKRAAAEALLEHLGYSKTSSQLPKPTIKTEKEFVTPQVTTDGIDKQRKVKFLEEKVINDTSTSTSVSGNTGICSSVGGSGGRQLVPGLLLMGDQAVVGAYQAQGQQNKQNINMQQTATIAKEFLKAGTSPTADALAGKSGVKPVQAVNKLSSTTQAIRSKDQLIYLAQLLGVQVQFSDFPKANHEMYLTLVSLSTTPPQVCHGEGPTTEASHEKAALEALTVLSELGLDNVIPKKEQPLSDGTVHGSKNSVMVKSTMMSNGIKK